MVVSRVRPDGGPAAVPPNAHTAFRAEVLELIGSIGLAPDEAVTLVEASGGHPLEACTPAELVPLLRDLLTLAQRTTRSSGGSACDV